MTDAIRHRLLSKSETNPFSGCWEWVAGKDTHGYGQMKINGRKRLAHRVSYELYRGPIPDGILVCHDCDNPACINPDHLFLGTQTENMADMMSKGRGRKARLKGEDHSQAKLTESDVVAILSAKGLVSQVALADQYGVSPSQIGNIHRGKAWTHIQLVGVDG